MPTFELTPQIMREIIMDHYSNPRHKGVPTGEGYKKVHTDSVNCIDDFDVYVKEEGGKKENYIHRERSFSCSRSYYVGDIRKEDIKAKYENGILNVVIPKEVREKAENHRIEIE